MKRFILLGAALLGMSSCTTTNRDQEILELRAQLEEARMQRAQAQAAAARAEAARIAAEEARAETTPETLFRQAQALEQEGKGREAVQLYIRTARMGPGGKAALRLGEIYNRGTPGVAPDFAESLRWYTAARALGENVQLKKP